jgi:uncharacterized protein YlxW (UPF0749 family)
MGTLTKTFIVLNLVFCIAFVAVTATVLSQRVHWKEKSFALQSELEGKTNQWAAERRLFLEDQDRSNKRAERLSTEVSELRNEVTRSEDSIKLLQEDLRKLDTEKTNLTKLLGDALDTTKAEKGRAEALSASLATAQEKAATLQTEVDQLHSTIVAERARSATNEVRIAELLHRLKVSQDALAWHKDYRKAVARIAPDADDRASGGGGLKETHPPEPIRAAVKAVDPSIKVVVLNVGSDNRVPIKKGYQFWIYRDQTFVAAVRVVNVDKDMSAAEIIPPETGLQIQVGDLALTEF